MEIMTVLSSALVLMTLVELALKIILTIAQLKRTRKD